MTVLVGGGAADVDDVVSRVWSDFPRTARVHRHHDVHRPVRPAPLGRPADQGAGDEHPLDRRLVRRAGVDLPGRQPVRPARVPAARLRRDHAARDPVLRPVRAVDGLRGVPPVADEGGLGPDRRQHRGRRPRPRAVRAGSSAPRRSSSSSSRDRSRSPTSCSSRRWGWASRSRWRSTRPWSGRCSCPRRCASSGSGTGGSRNASTGRSSRSCRGPRPRWRPPIR